MALSWLHLARDLRAHYRGLHNVRVLGFVPNLPDYFAASDVVVAKPGPSTILELEALAKRTVLTGDLGPQEVGNIRFALRRSLVRSIGRDWRKLPGVIDELLEAPDDPDPPRQRHHEATIIAEHLVGLLHGGESTG